MKWYEAWEFGAIVANATIAWWAILRWRSAAAGWQAAIVREATANAREVDARTMLHHATERARSLENAARNVLLHEERGQGVLYAEAMRDLARITHYSYRPRR
jgi:hypothetical protein